MGGSNRNKNHHLYSLNGQMNTSLENKGHVWPRVSTAMFSYSQKDPENCIILSGSVNSSQRL